MIVLRLLRHVPNVRPAIAALLAGVALSACNASSSDSANEQRAAADGKVETANEQLRNEQFQAYAAQSQSDQREAQADGQEAMATREKELQDEARR